MLVGQMGQGQSRVAGTLPIQLPIGSNEPRFSFAGQLHHSESLLAGGALSQLLVRRNAVHHEDDFIQPQGVSGAAGHIQMSVVDGVEASP